MNIREARRDGMTIKRLVETYGKADLINYIRFINEGDDIFTRLSLENPELLRKLKDVPSDEPATNARSLQDEINAAKEAAERRVQGRQDELNRKYQEEKLNTPSKRAQKRAQKAAANTAQRQFIRAPKYGEDVDEFDEIGGDSIGQSKDIIVETMTRLDDWIDQKKEYYDGIKTNDPESYNHMASSIKAQIERLMAIRRTIYRLNDILNDANSYDILEIGNTVLSNTSQRQAEKIISNLYDAFGELLMDPDSRLSYKSAENVIGLLHALCALLNIDYSGYTIENWHKIYLPDTGRPDYRPTLAQLPLDSNMGGSNGKKKRWVRNW